MTIKSYHSQLPPPQVQNKPMNKDRMEIVYSYFMRREQYYKDDSVSHREVSERALHENEDLLQTYLEHFAGELSRRHSYVEQFKQEVRSLVARGKITDAIYQLSHYVTEQKDKNLQDVLMVSSSFMRLHWEETSGVISFESSQVEKNRIISNILRILDNL
ncbi:MAG: Effector-associated domain 11 [Bacteroidota bacterium]